MNPPVSSAPALPAPLLRRAGALLLVSAILLAFGAGWTAPFLFDDLPNLADSRELRAGDFVGFVGREPADPGSTLAGRPLARVGLAINRAVGGHSPASYRAGNILLHALGALLVLGAVRRILALPAAARWRGAGASEGVALTVAALWALHPLQTAAVSYAVQRVEVQAGVLMLAALYAFVRALGAAKPAGWLACSWSAALAAAATKETAVVLPVAILLVDRVVGAGSWRGALQARPRFYASLAATWLVLVALVAGTGGRGGTAGFDAGLSPWHYLLTQAEAICTYLHLMVWPDPLIFDYGTSVAAGPGEVWGAGLVVLGGLGGTLWALRRGWAWGWAGVWLFLFLAPTSSFVPVASQTIAEHRVYVALLGPVVALVALACRLPRVRLAWVAGGCVVLLAGLTAQRAMAYRSVEGLWRDTVEKRPDNARARVNLALALQAEGRGEEALAQLDRAVRLAPRLADAHYNRGVALARLGRRDEARAAYQSALEVRPAHAEAHNNLGNLAVADGRWEEAARAFTAAVAIRPDFAEAESNLSMTLLELRRPAEAVAHAERAVALAPDLGAAQFNLGNALAASGRFSAARAALERAAALEPDNADVRANLGNVLVELEQFDAALGHYEAALRVRPQAVQALRNSATILAMQGRRAEALARFERLLALNPRDAHAADAVRRLRAGG